MSKKLFKYGEIYWVKFAEETIGTEIKDNHPGLIISDDWYNEEGERVIVLPCSSALKTIYPFEVFLENLANNGKNGKVMVDQIRSIDKKRLLGRVNQLTPEQLKKVNEILFKLFKLKTA